MNAPLPVVRITFLHIGAGREIGTDHFEAITARFASPPTQEQPVRGLVQSSASGSSCSAYSDRFHQEAPHRLRSVWPDIGHDRFIVGDQLFWGALEPMQRMPGILREFLDN